VPRHPERGQEIFKELSAHRETVVALRSQGVEIDENTDIYIADTIGELGLFYRAIPVVLIGKTLLSPGGGQNPIEPAKLGCAIVMGEHTSNFTEISTKMANSDAAIIMNFEHSQHNASIYNLAEEICALIKNKNLREKYAENAMSFANDEATVLDRVYAKIEGMAAKKL
jgi:3-deoxy-D-manno-octulosonic-acid transferase